MADSAPRFVLGLVRSIDARLRDVSRKLRRTLRLVRALVAFLVVVDILIVAAAVLVVVRPEYTPYVTAFLLGVLLLPMIALTLLATLPLRFRSVIRLIEKGYPANVRELALRTMARKFRDQSIETEELLAEAAWNEVRKILRRQDASGTDPDQARAEAARAAQAARAAAAERDTREAADAMGHRP